MLGLPSCKQVTEMSSQLLDDKLTGLARFKLKVHLMMCDRCRRYQQQMQLTSATIRYWIQGRKMPEQVKAAIIQRIKDDDCHH